MSITLFELAGKNPERRFSPYCWRTLFALHHKGLAFDRDIIRFCDKSAISFCDSKTVPVIKDGDNAVADSFEIARYLDKTYPDLPELLGGSVGEGQAKFIENWVNSQILPAIFRMIILDIYEGLADTDKEYFRETREKRFNLPLEKVFKYDDEQKATLHKALTPLRNMLDSQPFICGQAPAYSDYILMGCFMFARSSSNKTILDPNDPVHKWLDPMLNLYDGLGLNIQQC
ncbi:MAG: glutathione S-transferase N-terminal domain-containing protein [Alphaproteobacteria bacterium]|nr:glutathione S-transferase N-terminal domain-containing protein [Alphaproteobacteria bacterium]